MSGSRGAPLLLQSPQISLHKYRIYVCFEYDSHQHGESQKYTFLCIPSILGICIAVPDDDHICRDIEKELGEDSYNTENASFDPHAQNCH